MKKSKHALDIVSVIENLELPVPDNSIKKIDIESKNTLKKPEVGCSLDDILKQKIISLNGDKVYIYHNKNIKKVGDANVFENSYEHIYKIVNNKYGSSIYRNIDNKEEINNTANYLTQLIKQIDFRQFKAKQLIGINWKLIQGKSLPNTTIRLMVNKYEVDIVMDDLIIDIKTYDNIKFSYEDFIQIFLYYIWLNCIFLREESKDNMHFRIKRLGIFYSKYNYLWSFPLSDIGSKKELNVLIDFCKPNIENKNEGFKSELTSLFRLIRNTRASFQPKKAKKSLQNELQQCRLQTLEDLLKKRKFIQDIVLKEEISDLIVQINKDYCHSNCNLE